MREGDPKRKVPEHGGRTPGRKDYPAKRVPAGRRPVTPPHDSSDSSEAEELVASTGDAPRRGGRTPRRRIDTIPSKVTTLPHLTDDELSQLSIGERIARFRQKSGSTTAEFGKRLGRTGQAVIYIEKGQTTDLSPEIITKLKQVTLDIDKNGWEAMQLRQALEEIEAGRRRKEALTLSETEVRWLQTFARPGMTIGDSVRYIRLSTGLSQGEFAGAIHRPGTVDTHRSKSAIEKNENNVKSPSFEDLNLLIRLAGLDPERKPAQFLRLQTERHEVWSVDDLQERTFGDLMNYLRILKGARFPEIAEKIGYSASSLSRIKNNEYPMRAEAIEHFIDWLNLSPESSLAAVIRSKNRNAQEIISDNTLEQVLGEGYLFAEHIGEIQQIPLLQQDERLLGELKGQRSLGAKARLLRERRKRKESKEILLHFWESRDMFRKYIYSLSEEGGQKQEHILARFLMVYGYPVTHPIAWHFLDHVRPLAGAIAS